MIGIYNDSIKLSNLTNSLMKQDLFTTDCIRTHSGLYMNVLDPKPEMICIEDIAHSLAHQCRWGGHTPVFYSVAQHSVLCSRSYSLKYQPNWIILQALLHDASKAYLLDMPRPIKSRMPEYKKIEDRLMTIIAETLGFEYPISETVKIADNNLLRWEYEVLIESPDYHGSFVWEPILAKREFLNEYHNLRRELL